MKKCVKLVGILLLCLILCSCAAEVTTHTVTKNGTEYVISTGEKTVSDGQYTYQYTLSGNKESYNITVTYPNGAVYSYSFSSPNGSSGWDNQYDPVTYADGETLTGILYETLLENAGSGITTGKLIAALLLAALGIFCIALPGTAWYLTRGWYYRDAEPSDAALVAARISGGAFIVLAGLTLFL